MRGDLFSGRGEWTPPTAATAVRTPQLAQWTAEIRPTVLRGTLLSSARGNSGSQGNHVGDVRGQKWWAQKETSMISNFFLFENIVFLYIIAENPS